MGIVFQGLRDALNLRRNNSTTLIGNQTPVDAIAIFCNTSVALSPLNETVLLQAEVPEIDRQVVTLDSSVDQTTYSRFSSARAITVIPNVSSDVSFNTVLFLDSGDLDDSSTTFIGKTVAVTYNTATNITLPFAVREGFRLGDNSTVITPGLNTTVDIDNPIAGSPANAPFYGRYTLGGYRSASTIVINPTNSTLLRFGNITFRYTPLN